MIPVGAAPVELRHLPPHRILGRLVGIRPARNANATQSTAYMRRSPDPWPPASKGGDIRSAARYIFWVFGDHIRISGDCRLPRSYFWIPRVEWARRGLSIREIWEPRTKRPRARGWPIAQSLHRLVVIRNLPPRRPPVMETRDFASRRAQFSTRSRF